MDRDSVATGAATPRLDTNRALTEAVAAYRAHRVTESPRQDAGPFAHHWLEKAP